MARVYVGNLPFSVTKDEIESMFNNVTKASEVIMINDKDTKKFRGFAFVEIDDVNKAIELNGADCGGRRLIVNMAHEKKDNRPARY